MGFAYEKGSPARPVEAETRRCRQQERERRHRYEKTVEWKEVRLPWVHLRGA
jgi:hypothetical protein